LLHSKTLNYLQGSFRQNRRTAWLAAFNTRHKSTAKYTRYDGWCIRL